MESIKTNHAQQNFPKLIGDVGGTHARFALLDHNHTIYAQKTLLCAEFATFLQAVQAYLNLQDNIQISEAAVAIANPITGDQIQMTNHQWAFSIDETRQALGLQRLVFKNDFTALALAIPHLPKNELLQVGGGEPVKNSRIGVLGPGTGLGVSGLVYADGRWVALEGEGGHVAFSPINDRECDILKLCWKDYQRVSAERLISGSGLQILYQSICTLNVATAEDLSPADISNRAIEDTDANCVEALEIFCQMLGTVAGSLALTLGAVSGIYIGGGIIPRLSDYFVNSGFRERFDRKGRMAKYVRKIPVYVIQTPNPALTGISQVF